MAKFGVTKYFGHFAQCWNVEANSKDEAWDMAEKNGHRVYQQVYRIEMNQLYGKGYVVNLDEKMKEEPPISEDQYNQWLLEAIDKGMIVTKEEYESVTGLPFVDVF